MWRMKEVLVLVVMGAFAGTAAAQLRTIPKEAQLGEIRHLESMVVEIDGRPQKLSPGAQIRDPDNRLVVPGALAEKSHARYLLDATGLVYRVWILSPREKATLPPSPYPK
jgi:hypothetical protein